MPLIHTLQLSLDLPLLNELSQVDHFGGSWKAVEKREGRSLKELRSIATVRSVGASTRIEGSAMTDDEVSVLIKDIKVSKLEERDQQEVAGYFELLDIIYDSFTAIDITEAAIIHLHNILMKYSSKDGWHKGSYKQHSNVVQATRADGSVYIVFQTTRPGFETADAMRSLINWYNTDTATHPIIRVALFVYDFLSIHPFQDGNGRMSRLLTTLLLLKNGYSWIQYVSFEHEVEHRKAEYYNVLMQCQRSRPGEDVHPWVMFFLNCLNNIQSQLMHKLDTRGQAAQMAPKEKMVYSFIESHPGCSSGQIARKLDIPLPTIKKMLTGMVSQNMLVKHGVGKGTNYTVG